MCLHQSTENQLVYFQLTDFGAKAWKPYIDDKFEITGGNTNDVKVFLSNYANYTPPEVSVWLLDGFAGLELMPINSGQVIYLLLFSIS